MRRVALHLLILNVALATVGAASTPLLPVEHEQLQTVSDTLGRRNDVHRDIAHEVLPIVLWHGMGDTCCNPLSIGWLVGHLQDTYGAYVYSIKTGSGSTWADMVSGFYDNVNDMVARVCEDLRGNPKLANGFNFVGFSQGGQFARAVVQRCGHLGLRVKNLITLGAQHQGVVDIPNCTLPSWNATETGLCKFFMGVLGRGAYLPWIRNNIVQAQYFKDPFDYGLYLEHNPFLPDINNELPVIKWQYAKNLLQLERFVMFRFKDDYTVVPRDSAWFSWYDGHSLVPLEEQLLWTEDLLGLRKLNATGRLIKGECPGQHMHFTGEWFDENIVAPYLLTR